MIKKVNKHFKKMVIAGKYDIVSINNYTVSIKMLGYEFDIWIKGGYNNVKFYNGNSFAFSNQAIQFKPAEQQAIIAMIDSKIKITESRIFIDDLTDIFDFDSVLK